MARVSLSFHTYTAVVFMHLQQRDLARAPRDVLPIPLKGTTDPRLHLTGIKGQDTKNLQQNILAFRSLPSDIPLKWTRSVVQTRDS